HTPLLGAFSRYGWAHPGPALSFLLFVPAKYFFNPSLGVTLFALVLKWTPLTISFVLITRKFGRLSGLLFALFASVFIFHHREGIWTIWNPTIGLTLFLLLCVVAMTSADRSWSIALALQIAVLLIQFHVGYVAPTVALVALISFQNISHFKTKILKLKHVVHNLVGLIGAFILCIPPIIDQLQGTRNLSQLFRFFTSDSEPSSERVGMMNAIKTMSHQFLPHAAWNGARDMDSTTLNAKTFSSIWIFFLLSASIAIMVSLYRKRSELFTPFFVLILMILVSITTISLSTLPSFPYLFAWVTPITMLFWFLITLILVAHIPREIRVKSLYQPFITVVPICAIILTSLGMLEQQPRHLFEMRATEQLSRQAIEFLKDENRVGVLHTEPFAGIGFGVSMELEIAGKSLFVEPLFDDVGLHRERMWGKHRVNNPNTPLTLAVVRGKQISTILEFSDDWTLVATYDPEGLSQDGIFTSETSEQVVALVVRDNYSGSIG
ncbi:MAG: hypothetical protein RIR69_1739, partial [Actinomycetota bacterium]